MGQSLDMGKWKGLFEWSMKYQQDGTRSSEAQELAPDKKAWLEGALQDFMKDFADRMKEIKHALSDETQPATEQQQQQQQEGAQAAGGSAAAAGLSLSEKEALCDELMDIVESVDCARDLHKIGGLPTLLSLMSSPHPSLRWRAAEITATCMANNPPVQRWFMEGGALPPLLGLLADSHVVVRTKAVLALSALVRHFGPALEAFRLAGGLTKLLALLGCGGVDAAVDAAEAAGEDDEAAQEGRVQQRSQHRRLTRKVLALLHYMLLKHPADRVAAAEYGIVSQLQSCLDNAPDSDMRQAALSVLAELLAEPGAWQWVQQHEGQQGLVQQLQRLHQQHKDLNAEDREAEAEEGQLVGQCLSALQASQPPVGANGGAAGGAAAGMDDHVDVDPYQDGGDRAKKTIRSSLWLARPGAVAASLNRGLLRAGGGLGLEIAYSAVAAWQTAEHVIDGYSMDCGWAEECCAVPCVRGQVAVCMVC
ncbi:armadillo-type protein [Scenedesmus sp. NREL 46B-D3]|nr:armadillo-type protein [Scenedesmus sp. NREL 46B-D3]